MFDHTTRREFIERATASAAALAALSAANACCAKGANDKLVVGLIGCGGRGMHDAGLFAEDGQRRSGLRLRRR